MQTTVRRLMALLGVAAMLSTLAIIGQPLPEAAASGNDAPATMMAGVDNWGVAPIHTVGETVNGYTPPGVIDGLGAYELDGDTVRVLANHELLHFRGYPFSVANGFSMSGARISYFDVDKHTKEVVDSGLAINTIYDANGNAPTDLSFQPNNLAGFSRFCSGSLFEAHQFGGGRGFEDRIYMAGEEDGGFFSPVGGAEWALDPATGDIWHLPDLGRGAWENVTVLDTGDTDTVAVLLGDDTSPFDFDGDGVDEAAPLFLYVGEKDPNGDFPARNGLRGGALHVWVPGGSGIVSPVEFNTSGKQWGKWVEVDNSPTENASNDGSTGYDNFGYPTQGNLWLQAKELGAFGFSRPEDVATNPTPGGGNVAVVASTGVDSYVGGVDSFGTIYTIRTNFRTMNAQVTIAYDGDADPARQLRSPDNLDWADDNRLYIQEDEAEEFSGSGEPLFGDGAANPNEAGIIRMKPDGSQIERIANIDRSVILDASTNALAVDQDAGDAGEWESSGIVDVSSLFGERPGALHLINVQAHGIEDQTDVNPDSRINDGDLVEGGQLSFLYNSDFVDPDGFPQGEVGPDFNDVRFATFNASLNRNNAGDLAAELSAPGSAQPDVIAEIIQRTRPEVLLINEFDYDAGNVALDGFQDNYLSRAHGDAAPINYPYRYAAPSNTGVASGFDLDNSGAAGDFAPGDAFGFGFFEGQFGMAVYSMYPINTDDIRTFQNFLWKDMPGALLPVEPDGTPWYSDEELEVVRLSSKSHWDLPIQVGDQVVHFLVSHPTPPVFDGPEDRNGTRNHDEIRFWADYISQGRAGAYIYDDAGSPGGLPYDELFVIAGDQNSDPNDGDSIPGAIQQLLSHRRIDDTRVTPSSLGGPEQALWQGDNNADHLSDPAFDTADFGEAAFGGPGNLRVDYVLPRRSMRILEAGVFWPEMSDPDFALVGTFPFPGSDHRLVWVDVSMKSFDTDS